MKNENFEKKIEKICKADINIPIQFANTFENFANEKNINRRFFSMKKLAAVAVVAVLCLSVVFANDITSFVSGILSGGNVAISKALEYDYIQNVDVAPVVSGNTECKIESIVLDNANTIIVFDFNFDEKIKWLDDISLQGLKITDEKNNVIFGEGTANSLATGCFSKIASEDNKNIKQAVFIDNSSATNPKSEKLFISFAGIKIFNNQKEVKNIDGNWKFEIKVSEKFSNRESVSYIAEKNPDVKVLKAELTPTGFDIELHFEKPLNAETLMGKMKLVDDEGKEYKMIGSLGVTDESTNPKVKTSFQLSLFEAKENLKLIIKTDKEIVIELNQVK